MLFFRQLAEMVAQKLPLVYTMLSTITSPPFTVTPETGQSWCRST